MQNNQKPMQKKTKTCPVHNPSATVSTSMPLETTTLIPDDSYTTTLKCSCQPPQSTQESWEKDFDNNWNLHDYNNFNNNGSFTTCGEDVKLFIRQLLAQSKQETLDEIIKMINGIKEPKMPEKDFDAVPNKRGIWHGGYAQAKIDIESKIKNIK